jgi:transposase
MPADDCLRPEDSNRAEDGGEPAIEPNQEKAIGIVELWSLPAKDVELLAKDVELLAKDQYFYKQVAALVGVAPYAFESGKLKGARCIWGGRAPVRRVLYMAAMSASNWNPVLKGFHDRLAASGKKPKVTTVAVMRKMITTLNAMVRDDIVWADRLSSRHTVPTAR